MKKRFIANNIYRVAYAPDDADRLPGTENEVKWLVGRYKRSDRKRIVLSPVFFLPGNDAPEEVIINRSDVISIEALG